MVSQLSLNDSKSFKVSSILFNILADLNNAIVWMISTSPFISKSSRPCTNYLVTLASKPVTIVITVTFMFLSFFFRSLARSCYISIYDPFVSQNPREL